jgi:hypothetical protein
MTDRTGAAGLGQLVITKPQIINGGQTACSLAECLNGDPMNESKMQGKEVLLKVITEPKDLPQARLLEFIELISDATNQQTRVVEADRRANDAKMLKIQEYFYQKHGLFLERKRGEFMYGIRDKYLGKLQVVGRVDLIRNYLAFSGGVAKARSSQENIFEEAEFETLLTHFDEQRIFLSYETATQFEALVRPMARAPKKPGYAMGHAKYGVLGASGIIARKTRTSANELAKEAAELIRLTTANWDQFSDGIKEAAHNSNYVTSQGFSYDNYFKGYYRCRSRLLLWSFVKRHWHVGFFWLRKNLNL